MLKRNQEKKKLSIDFDVENYNAMQEFSQKHRMTNSSIVNYLVNHFLRLSHKTKIKFAKATAEQIDTLKKSFATCQEYEAIELEEQISVLQDLLLFFTDGKGYVEDEPQKMKKTEIQNGYVIFPTDWIVVDDSNAKYCDYVGVIEVRNGKSYNAPHFVFFSEFPINKLTDSLKDTILRKCELVHPDFRKIRSMQLEPVYGDNNEILNADLWMKAPIIGFFQIPTYGKDSSFPAGAMVVKSTSSQEDDF